MAVMPPKTRHVYYGWWNAAVSFSCLMLIFGTPTMLLPFVYGPVIDEFGWSRAEVTGIASFKFLSAAISALISGYLVDRYGVRAVIIGCCFITGIAMCGFLWVDSLLRYYAVGILLGLAATAIMVAVKTLMSRWFDRNQGLSIGVVMMGSSVAGVIIPFIAVPLIDLYGWCETFALSSLGIWLFALPLFLLVARETPTEAELNRELGDRRVVSTPASEHGYQQETLADVMRVPMFWIIVAAVFIMSFVDQGINQHTILFIESDLGLGRDFAARAFSAIFAAGVFAKVAFGWIYDRTSIRGIQGCYLLMGISIALAFPIAGALTMYTFAVLRGTAHGGLLIQTAMALVIRPFRIQTAMA